MYNLLWILPIALFLLFLIAGLIFGWTVAAGGVECRGLWWRGPAYVTLEICWFAAWLFCVVQLVNFVVE